MNERPGNEPKLMFPKLAVFYALVADLWYPMVRITIGVILVMHGWAKITGPGLGGVTGYFAKIGLAPAGGLALVAIVLETIGALCVAAGLFTRFFAAGLAIELAIAFLFVHLQKGFQVGGGGYEYVLLLGVVSFAIALRGGGPYSLDRLIGKEL